MTYTFKLARRLAVSRTFGMLPAILLFVACSGGDATGPENPTSPLGPRGEWRPREALPVTVSVNPGDVTVETNQLIRFLAHGTNQAGDSVYAPITWRTTGGTILPDGRFSSSAVGSFMVTGTTYDGGAERVDTALVKVVRRQPNLQSIEVTPESVSLASGVQQNFIVVGRVKDGRPVPVGVNWTATGGVIDAGGNYVPGDSAGTYLIIGTHTAMTIADTATVTITAPPAPPEPPTSPPEEPGAPPEEPPAPVVEKVTLVPASATLAPSATRQFSAYGRTTTGDSIAVTVAFAATGGTVTNGGLYTAGQTAGTYRVIASSNGLADTSTITVTQPLGSGPAAGIPFGAFHVPVDSLNRASLSYNGAVLCGEGPAIAARLETIRERKGRVVLCVLRKKLKDAGGRLSVAAAKAELATWPDISSYLADGTVMGVYIFDDFTAAHWGNELPPKARVDSLGLLIRNRWPGATTFVRVEPSKLTGYTWKWISTAWAQYDGPFRDGSPQSYRDREVAAAKALKLGLVLWFNTLNGGCGPTSACLPGVPGTSILGTYANSVEIRRYQLSAAEALHYGKIFLAEPYNCAAIAWQWSPVFKTSVVSAEQLAAIQNFDRRSDVRASMAQLAVIASQRNTTSCRQG